MYVKVYTRLQKFTFGSRKKQCRAIYGVKLNNAINIQRFECKAAPVHAPYIEHKNPLTKYFFFHKIKSTKLIYLT